MSPTSKCCGARKFQRFSISTTKDTPPLSGSWPARLRRTSPPPPPTPFLRHHRRQAGRRSEHGGGGGSSGATLTASPTHSPDHHVGVFTLRLDPGASFTLPPAAHGHINRNVYFFKGPGVTIDGRNFSRHCCLEVRADAPLPIGADGGEEVELLVLQGQPIDQPVVQHGPFVMNSREEIMQAFQDYQSTQFGGVSLGGDGQGWWSLLTTSQHNS